VMIDEGRARFKTRGEGKDDPGGILSEVFNRKSLSVQYAVAGVMVFKGMLERSDLLIFAGEELTSARIPVIVAVAALPFIAGMVTGLAIGFSGTAFPLVVGLVAARATGITQLSALPIAFGFGYMGMMLSPVHLCLVVTRKYFGAGSIKTYREYMPCVIATLVYSIAVHVFLRVIRS